MAERLEPAEEIKRLQSGMNDLVSLLALPGLWSGGEPSQIARALLDVLPGMLRLDLLYVRLMDGVGGTALEIARTARSNELKAWPREIGEALDHCLGDDPRKWPALVRDSIGNGDISIVPVQLGLQGEMGVIVAASERADFPGQTEQLLLSVAANQAAIGLQEARLLSEQKRIANALDQRVAQRTAELAAANQELEKEVAERRRAEDALRVRELNARLIVDSIPALVALMGPTGEMELVNRQVLEYFGRTLEEVKKWGTSDAVHPDELPLAIESFGKSVATGDPYEIEHRLRRFDGVYRWFQARGLPLRDTEGRIVRWYVVLTDIEDRKRAEERTRLIIDTALDAVVTMDTQGAVTSWNKQAEAIFGWTQEEAIGRQLSDMIIPERQRMAHRRGLRHFLATGEGPILGRRIEATAIRRSGAEFPVELEVVPLRLGEEWSFSAFLRDITDSKLAEEKLRESELDLRQLTETIPEMLWSASPEGVIEYCNARLLDYTGFPAEEVMGDGWKRLLHPDDVDQTDRVWMSCVATGAPYRVEVRAFHAADRTYRWCVTSALPLLDEQGRILKWHGTVVDMHDWKQAQEALRDTQAALAHVTRVTMMGELTASIAHEVNQPLSAIVINAGTCLRMLAADPPNVEGARETARRTILDGNRASEVVTRLRALFAKKGTTTDSVDLNEAAREVIALSSSQLQKGRVILRPEFSDDLPPVTGDRVQLQQVILNLLLNASDAMSGIDDRPRQLVIRTERDESDRVRLSVQDAGVGIVSQDPEKLFEAFYTTKSDGMGIGLSVSRSIIDNHHGRLWAAPNDGPGATFSFSIPQRSDQATVRNP